MKRPASLAEQRRNNGSAPVPARRAFYANQMLDHLNPLMQQFIARQSQYSCLTQNP